MKSNRQRDIVRIIENKKIETQEELADELRAIGYRVTQATISRDIRDLHLIKSADGHGVYKYVRSEHGRSAVSDRLVRILSDSLVSAEQGGFMIVVKTLSGSAGVAAEAIDTMQWKEVLGTIAGDNTIFIVARSEYDAGEITARLQKLISHT